MSTTSGTAVGTGKLPGTKITFFFLILVFFSMNQGKLEVVKQEMARANINIIGISELRWTEIGEFNS